MYWQHWGLFSCTCTVKGSNYTTSLCSVQDPHVGLVVALCQLSWHSNSIYWRMQVFFLCSYAQHFLLHLLQSLEPTLT